MAVQVLINSLNYSSWFTIPVMMLCDTTKLVSNIKQKKLRGTPQNKFPNTVILYEIIYISIVT